MWLENIMVMDDLGTTSCRLDTRLHDSSSRTSRSNCQLFRRRKRCRGSTVKLTFSKAMLVIALLITIQEGNVANAYYYEYPTTLFGRAPNGHAQYGRKDDFYTQNSISPSISGITRLASSEGNDENLEQFDGFAELERKLMRRITRLEALVSKQEMEIHRLKKTNEDLVVRTEAFAKVIQLLREAGLGSSEEGNSSQAGENKTQGANTGNAPSAENESTSRVVESFDDSMIFGTAPASVNDAADAAGAAILAAMLGGKQRMLIDVRDAELSSDPETLVQFIELAILPIAAGLEGLKSTRNRVKIVFPKVSQLLEYRRTMALAAPEVVALSTLGFDPVERRDKLVVIVAPAPDDEEGLIAMKELLYPADSSQSIQQPIVILNYHMIPVAEIKDDFETAYHLRLLSVQYISGEMANELLLKAKAETALGTEIQALEVVEVEETDEEKRKSNTDNSDSKEEEGEGEDDDDEALEAAMKHAHELGINQGATRAMVIRAYPRPWHVFVDTAPDTDTDFEVAATFDEEPSLDEINMAIVECLEGSEREDELVAQQMQQALEEGQLDRVNDLIGKVLDFDDDDDEAAIDEEDDDDLDDEDFDMFEEDSV